MAYQKLFNLLSKQYNISYIDSGIVNDIINVCREIIAKENEVPPKSIYQVGDTVYHFNFGVGVVSSIEDTREQKEPIMVEFKKDKLSFTIDGKYYPDDAKPSLSFTPCDLINGGFSQERPKPEPKIGDWGYFWDFENKKCVFDCIDKIYNNCEYKYLTKRSEEYKFFSVEIPEHIKNQMK